MCKRLANEGYAAILAMIVKGPTCWRDVEAAHGWSRTAIHGAMFDLLDAGLVHIAAWTHDSDWRSARPKMVFGPGEDAPGPARRRKRMSPRPGCVPFVNAVRAMMIEPHNGVTLAGVTGQVPRAARGTIRALHRAGLVHIDHYHDRGAAGAGYPLYAWGPGLPDARKPRPKPTRALTRRHNKERRAREASIAVMHALANTGRVSTKRLIASAGRLRGA